MNPNMRAQWFEGDELYGEEPPLGDLVVLRARAPLPDQRSHFCFSDSDGDIQPPPGSRSSPLGSPQSGPLPRLWGNAIPRPSSLLVGNQSENATVESNLAVDPHAIHQTEIIRRQAEEEQLVGKVIGSATGKDYEIHVRISLEIADAILYASDEI
jgi:hypothetical protein